MLSGDNYVGHACCLALTGHMHKASILRGTRTPSLLERTLAPELADVLARLSLMSTLGRVHEKECLTRQQFKS